MITQDHDGWLDGDAGRMVRLYAVTRGRTMPSVRLDLLSMVVATGNGVTRPPLDPDHLQVLRLCQRPVAVAEVAARVRLPAAVTKVLLSDLVDDGAVRTAPPAAQAEAPDRVVLERVLDGLQRRLA